jgi:hypothetical protein
LAVRSSSVKEDSEGVSFAGIHESFINISDEVSLMKAIRMVWASLWSDAALLYRKDPSNLHIEQEPVGDLNKVKDLNVLILIPQFLCQRLRDLLLHR